MRGISTYLVFLVVLILGLSPAVPAEDLPDTAYDESETQPYESNVPISNLMAQTASATQTALPEAPAGRNTTRLQTSTPFLLGAKPKTRSDAHRFTGVRSLLAQVCTLLF